jgi:hypothetical protein
MPRSTSTRTTRSSGLIVDGPHDGLAVDFPPHVATVVMPTTYGDTIELATKYRNMPEYLPACRISTMQW